MAHRFELVVFDLGGVLVRIARSWAEAHRLAGLVRDVPAEPSFLKTLAEFGERMDGSLSGPQFFEWVAAASGGVYEPDDVQRISDVFLRGEYPHVADVFDRLEAEGVETAVLSNTNDAHWARLASDDEQAEFPSVRRATYLFPSHLLGLMKPDPRIYRAVEEATGHASTEILFFDDLEANVAGARAAGWTADLVDHTGDPAAQLLAALRRHAVI